MLDLLNFLALITGLLGLFGGLTWLWRTRFKGSAQRLPYQNPKRPRPLIEIVGRNAVVMTPVGQGFRGTVEVEGELWAASLLAQDGRGQPTEIEVGRRVRIMEQRDLLLLVEPLPEAPLNWNWS
ncbi:MAG: NfeD family protein [Chloroflexi bacterium]|nr:NfeD family protein [Chloroflexota bacterium]